MKKNLLSTAAFSAAMVLSVGLLASCSRSDDAVPNPFSGEKTKALLEVRTNFGETATRSVLGRPISSFVSGDELGLFISNGSGVNTPYGGVAAYKNMKSTFTTVWTQAGDVYLTGANATVYAYYPYAAANTDGTVIPVDHTSQTDFLYGKSAPLNSNNPRANIHMKHALSLVRFNVKKANYTNTGSVTAITIANAPGKQSLASTGKLNIATGIIAKDNAHAGTTKAFGLPATIGTWSESQFPQIMVLPVSATVETGDIVVTFTIDGTAYTWKVPKGTAWEAGKRNTYTVTLNGTSISLTPDDGSGNGIVVDDWAPGNNAPVSLS